MPDKPQVPPQDAFHISRRRARTTLPPEEWPAEREAIQRLTRQVYGENVMAFQPPLPKPPEPK
jgi:hypothetical protein